MVTGPVAVLSAGLIVVNVGVGALPLLGSSYATKNKWHLAATPGPASLNASVSGAPSRCGEIMRWWLRQ